MSNLETMFFLLLDWSDEVLDIREQYPLLDLCGAVEIAEKAQIRYPYDMKSGFPYVMTSDFFISTTDGPSVITIKPSADLSKPRVREKLEIERRYWEKHGIRWRVVTENQINRVKAKNIEWLSQAKDLSQFGVTDDDQKVYITYFLIQFKDGWSPLGEIICDIEQEYGLPPGMGLNIYKHLAYWKQIAFDVCKEVDHTSFMDRHNHRGVWSA